MEFSERVESARRRLAEQARAAAEADVVAKAEIASQYESEQEAAALLQEAVEVLWGDRGQPKDIALRLGDEEVVLDRSGNLMKHIDGSKRPTDLIRTAMANGQRGSITSRSRVWKDVDGRLRIVANVGVHRNADSVTLDFVDWLATEVARLT